MMHLLSLVLVRSFDLHQRIFRGRGRPPVHPSIHLTLVRLLVGRCLLLLFIVGWFFVRRRCFWLSICCRVFVFVGSCACFSFGVVSGVEEEDEEKEEEEEEKDEFA